MKTKEAVSIIEKQQYNNVTELFKEKVGQAVDVTVGKMKELQIRTLDIPGIGGLQLTEHGSQFHYELFQWKNDGLSDPYNDEDLSGDLLSSHKTRADTEQSGSYYGGDFNHWISYPSKSAVMKFASNFDKILKALEKEEDKAVSEAQKAIELIDNLTD